MTEINTLDPVVTAADYLISALGKEGAQVAMWALRADWLLVREAESVEDLAVSIAYLLGEDCPRHHGQKTTKHVVAATSTDVGDAIAAHLYKEDA
jgi:hypothetical protein